MSDDMINFVEVRERLSVEIKRQGRSMSEVSSSAGLGVTYVRNFLEVNRSPTVQKFEAVCGALGVSLTWVLYGKELSREVGVDSISVGDENEQR